MPAADEAKTPMPQDTPQVEIAIRVRTIMQLFNSFDPSPFRERDIDTGVEAFIYDWVRELPPATLFAIVVHLPPEEAARPEAARIGEAFRHYFEYRAQVVDFELRELFRVGRRSLAIGIAVLAMCPTASQWFAPLIPNATAASIVRESLIIVGWVANWRPIEIYLYEWWPIPAPPAPARVHCGCAGDRAGGVDHLPFIPATRRSLGEDGSRGRTG